MGLHQQLPIYTAARDLFSMTVKFAEKMPRSLRGAVGNRLIDETFEMATLVVKANVAKEKVPFLDKMIEFSAALDLLFRMCLDLKLISPREYAQAIELNGSVGRQAGGWRKAQR